MYLHIENPFWRACNTKGRGIWLQAPRVSRKCNKWRYVFLIWMNLFYSDWNLLLWYLLIFFHILSYRMQIWWCCLLWLWSNKTNKMATEPPHRRRCSLRENKKWDKKLWHCWFPSRYVPIYSITVLYAFYLHKKANLYARNFKVFHHSIQVLNG